MCISRARASSVAHAICGVKKQFVEPSKRFADIIVLDGGYNLVALDMIMGRIQDHIK